MALPPLEKLQKRLISCRKCPRLVRYLSEIRNKYPTYWCRPVPVFGDRNARILLLGLAPGRFGSNRTGRMFTGDASGKFLFKTLYDLGLASKDAAVDKSDGLKLKNVLISAVVRCAPPQNKPTGMEICNCSPYFENEIDIMESVSVVVALGKIAHDAFVRMKVKREQVRAGNFEFRHGNIHRFRERPSVLVDVYHPSRQNTNTGRLTMPMFKSVLRQAIKLASMPMAGDANRALQII